MLSEVQEFYKNQTIFITGGTGSIGKLIIEKLLRVCFDLKRIYLLVRPKKDKTPEERFADFFNSPCFDVLKKQRSDFQSKLQLIVGDCTQTNLGISTDDWELLSKEITCIFHVAASLRFDEPLRLAAKANILSTQEVLRLAESATALKIFVHVSTAFSYCPYQYIDERFYKPPIQPDVLLNFIDGVNDEILDKITPELLGRWPNTYCYTKAVAEALVHEASKKLPVALIRPSIVITTFVEPTPGWFDQFYGLIAIMSAVFLGLIKSTRVDFETIAHLVPADYVVNATIITAWDHFQGVDNKLAKTKIYNFTASVDNFISWRKLGTLVQSKVWEYPLLKAITYPNGVFVQNPIYHRIRVFFWHTCVSYLADFILRIMGREPIAVKNYKRVNKALNLTEYFSTNFWAFDQTNVKNMWKRLSESDKKLFQFNMDTINLHDFISTGIKGLRKFLLKEEPDTIEAARKRLYRLMIIHYSFLGFLILIAYFFIKFVVRLFV